MQTFLPYSHFRKSAEVLDYKRLGKQRVETYQILRALDGMTKGWVNHPATKMWRGYSDALAFYGLIMCNEWVKRGYKDTLAERFINRLPSTRIEYPLWLGDERIHISHQSNLIRKAPEIYTPIFGAVPNDIPYYWATEELQNA